MGSLKGAVQVSWPGTCQPEPGRARPCAPDYTDMDFPEQHRLLVALRTRDPVTPGDGCSLREHSALVPDSRPELERPAGPPVLGLPAVGGCA